VFEDLLDVFLLGSVDAVVIGSCFYSGVIRLCWTELCIGQRRLPLNAS